MPQNKKQYSSDKQKATLTTCCEEIDGKNLLILCIIKLLK